jgi:hypothetical protein
MDPSTATAGHLQHLTEIGHLLLPGFVDWRSLVTEDEDRETIVEPIPCPRGEERVCSILSYCETLVSRFTLSFGAFSIFMASNFIISLQTEFPTLHALLLCVSFFSALNHISVSGVGISQ